MPPPRAEGARTHHVVARGSRLPNVRFPLTSTKKNVVRAALLCWWTIVCPLTTTNTISYSTTTTGITTVFAFGTTFPVSSRKSKTETGKSGIPTNRNDDGSQNSQSLVVRSSLSHSSFNGRRRSSTSTTTEQRYSIRDSFNLLVLGDLHMEDNMTTHKESRRDCLRALERLSLLPCQDQEDDDDDNDTNNMSSNTSFNGADSNENSDITVSQLLSQLEDERAGDLSINELEMLLSKKKEGLHTMKSYLVSLGDLGRKDIRHEAGDAGTTKSFEDAKEFFDGFDGIPYNLVTGNHDLEGLDEFDSDEDNLQSWMKTFDLNEPYFCRQIGERTLLIGLSTVRFRDAPYSSHEVFVDEAQIQWFMDTVESHSHKDGWKILVFSHAPIMGSGLRVLQSVHVVNGCAWLNHCCSNTRKLFIQTVKNNPQIKLWCSGHFHLSHDYEDAISTVGSCTFLQVGVMGPVSTRDGRRQTRLIQGTNERLKIWSINHHKRIPFVTTSSKDDENNNADDAELRLDAEINLNTGDVNILRESDDYNHNSWFSAYVPEEEDGCYLAMPDGQVACSQTVQKAVCWWHMKDGKVLGLHEGQLVEYDEETLSPLGIVVPSKELGDREVYVINDGTAVALMNDDNTDGVEIVHPNDDGSYWRKYQRNKRIRQEEKAREQQVKLWLDEQRSKQRQQQQ